MLIVGIARDIENVWANTANSLQIIFDAVEDYHCIIVESNSKDNTLNLLREWATDSRRQIISLGNVDIKHRTSRLARCRNEYTQHFKEHSEKHEYTLILDLDDSLKIEPEFKEQLDTCFERSDWDAVASNRRNQYYDIWALRSGELGINYDCWQKVGTILCLQRFSLTKHGLTREELIDRHVKNFYTPIHPDRPWIKCQSAFGCMVLYRTKSILKKKYDGASGCEHVSFHAGLNMFINPRFFSG